MTMKNERQRGFHSPFYAITGISTVWECVGKTPSLPWHPCVDTVCSFPRNNQWLRISPRGPSHHQSRVAHVARGGARFVAAASSFSVASPLLFFLFFPRVAYPFYRKKSDGRGSTQRKRNWPAPGMDNAALRPVTPSLEGPTVLYDGSTVPSFSLWCKNDRQPCP